MKFHTRVIFDLLRVKQWVKNGLVYVALLFTNNLFNPDYFIKVTIGFFLLSFTSSALYIMNDIRDRKEDAHHPVKKNRPIASGAVDVNVAFGVSMLLLIASLIGAYFLGLKFFYVILAYVVLTTCYTLWLKHMVIIDVFTVATGFVLRPIAGAFIINVIISPWLLICTSLLALFVVMSKRRYEINSLTDASKHRKILAEYSVPLLDEMISIVTTSTIIAYSLYTFTSETASNHHYMMLTIPFVLYGIFRYLYLMHKKNLGGSPELIFIKDIPMVIAILLWIASNITIVYFVK